LFHGLSQEKKFIHEFKQLNCAQTYARKEKQTNRDETNIIYKLLGASSQC